MSKHPSTRWAERKDKLFITIDVSNATDVAVGFTDKSVVVTGTGNTASSDGAQPFALTINFQKPVNPSGGSYKVLGQTIQLVAEKAESGPFWGRMTEEPTKATKQWLSADWNLWKDEDEVDEGEKIDFGGYGDLQHMLQNKLYGEAEPDSDDEEERPVADLSDLDN